MFNKWEMSWDCERCMYEFPEYFFNILKYHKELLECFDNQHKPRTWYNIGQRLRFINTWRLKTSTKHLKYHYHRIMIQKNASVLASNKIIFISLTANVNPLENLTLRVLFLCELIMSKPSSGKFKCVSLIHIHTISMLRRSWKSRNIRELPSGWNISQRVWH